MATLNFEIIDHGVDGEQYFPGCGVAHTRFTKCVSGVGKSAREAFEDARDSMGDLPPGIDDSALMAEGAKLSDATNDTHATCSQAYINDLRDDVGTFEEWHEACEMHHYVSIRWSITP